MELVKTTEELFAGIQNVKAKGGAYLTNFFFDGANLDRWIKNQWLFTIEVEEGLLLFRKDNTFYHLYYFTNGYNQLSSAIKNLPNKKLALDIIGNIRMAGAMERLTKIFLQQGFKNHTQLRRYARIQNEASNFYAYNDEVQFAEARHRDRILTMFEMNFDPYSEQLPDAAQIENYILNKNIIIVEQNNELKGLLINTRNGYTSTLNNFLVDSDYRNGKIGSKLLKHFIHSSKDCKRVLLWVLENNHTAINVYKHHGFVEDNLVDYVLIN